MIAQIKKMALICLPNFIKIFLLRRNGEVGENVVIGSGSWIYSSGFKIGNNVKIGEGVKIISAKIIIGNDVIISNNVTIQADRSVEIGDESLINKNTTIGGGQTHESTLFIGKRVHIYQDCFLNTTMPLTIEDGVGVGGGTYIFTHGSWQNAYEGFPFGFGPVTIKKNAWLPWRVFVMPGVTIGEEATIGSNALVGKDIPARSFAVGIPAKVIKQGNEYIKEMSADDKLKLMRQVFDRYAGHLNFYFKMNPSVNSSANDVVLVDPSGYSCIFSVNSNIDIKYDVILGESIMQSSSSNVFDLKAKQCRYSNDKKVSDLRDILTGFGIRFDKV